MSAGYSTQPAEITATGPLPLFFLLGDRDAVADTALTGAVAPI